VLIDHLSYGIAQENDILIEGFNITLQFNSINKIDGDRNMLFAQGIEERIL
jgi:hypothetical protein